MITTYDAPAELIAVASSVTSVVCTCSEDIDVELDSLALGLNDGMVIGLSDLRVAANRPLLPDESSLQDMSTRLGCEPAPATVALIADIAISHVVNQRQIDNGDVLKGAPPAQPWPNYLAQTKATSTLQSRKPQ